jgi:two-component system response regulator YesN
MLPSYPLQNEHYIKKLNDNILLERLLDSFSTITRMNVAVTDVDGNYLLTSKKEEAEFCRLIKSTSQGLERCCSSYARAGREAEKWNEPYFF